MTKSALTKSVTTPWLNGESVTYLGLIWGAIALVFYLNFSVVAPISTRPAWFIVATTGFEQVALVMSAYLCWRNWCSNDLPSSKAVWLLFAIALGAFFMGNLWFGAWEIFWGLNPAASGGNLFFALFYLMAIAGMRLAILDRDVRLVRQQWVIVGAIVAIGLTIGCWLSAVSVTAAPAPASPVIASMNANTLPSGNSVPSAFSPQVNNANVKTIPSPPEWVLEIDRSMQPLVETFNLFYVLCDLVLLAFAAIMLLGFWGGQLGWSWRTLAQAVLCFYIADTWFAYANNRVQGYESGFIMEVFWVFGIIQFGIAAALEFDRSIRARRLARRRTGIN